tara:strand:- start:394 stop:1296 length:903 start_codon:yes stop_codon:yes gene_type:complete
MVKGFFESITDEEWETAFANANKPASKNTYTVRSGDSFWKIAENLGINWKDLLAANNLSIQDVQGGAGTIYKGDVLKLPAGAAEATVGAPDVVIDDPSFKDPDSDVKPTPDVTKPIVEPVADEVYEMDWDAPDDDYDWVAPTAPVQGLVGDPAYDAFLAQYGFDVGAAEQSRISQGLVLQGSMSRQLGALTDPTADPYSQTAARTGGAFDLGRERQLEQSSDVYAGRGMGFSGGKFKAAADIGTDWGQKEDTYWSEINREKALMDQRYMDQRRQLEMEKLAQESAAYQRRVTEDIMSQYG